MSKHNVILVADLPLENDNPADNPPEAEKKATFAPLSLTEQCYNICNL